VVVERLQLREALPHRRLGTRISNARLPADGRALRRYVVRWLKGRLTGRPERGDLLYELKRWLYERHILIVHDRLLKRLIVKAGQDVEESLIDGVIGAFGATRTPIASKEENTFYFETKFQIFTPVYATVADTRLICRLASL